MAHPEWQGTQGYTPDSTMRRDDLLDLNDVLQHPGRKIEVEITTELSEEADLDLLSPLDGYLEAVSTGNLLLITGEFTTRAVVECSRCSAPIEIDVAFEVDEQFPVEGVPSSLSHQDMAKVKEEEPYPLFEGNSLMVEALLRQDLLLAMPLQPTCPGGCEPTMSSASKASSGRPEFASLANLIQPEEEAP